MKFIKIIVINVINVFVLRAHYVEKISSDQPFDCSVDVFKNARKVATPIRKAISSLDLSLDKYFDQIGYIPSELISLISWKLETILHLEMHNKAH